VTDDLVMTIANRLSEVARLATAIETFGAAHGLHDDVVFAFNLALDEVLTNTISYGYDGVGERDIRVRLGVRAGVVQAQVEDDGRPFNPLNVPPPDLDAPLEDRPIGGLGLHIVRSLMDDVEYRHDGARNILTLRKRAH
jgi:anti-sigma regulatory factor (Ser/Thr protein kinase)